MTLPSGRRLIGDVIMPPGRGGPQAPPPGLSNPNIQRGSTAGAQMMAGMGGYGGASGMPVWNRGGPPSGGTTNYNGPGGAPNLAAPPNFGWDPIFADPTSFEIPRQKQKRVHGPNRPKGAFFGNNTPHYGTGQAGSLIFQEGGGWWRDPAYATQNAGGYWHDMSGAGQDANKAMAGLTPYGTPLGIGPGGAPRGDNGPPTTAGMRGGGGGGAMPVWGGGGGGMGGYGGGGGGGQGYAPGVQDFVDYMNIANQKNADRQNNVSSGYEAMKDWIHQQMAGLGDQQRKDINTTFDKEKGRLTQDMISRGLTASTVLDNMQKGNERTRGEALNRLSDQLTMNMVNTTLPVWSKELDFLTDVHEDGPDLGLMAQLLQQANSAGGMNGYGGGGGGGYAMGGGGGGMGAGVPITIDSGDIGFQIPMMGGGGMPGWIQGGGMTVPPMRGINNYLAGLQRNQRRLLQRRPHTPMVFGPGGSSAMGPGSGMLDMFDPDMMIA
jgi:hypothetical protein